MTMRKRPWGTCAADMAIRCDADVITNRAVFLDRDGVLNQPGLRAGRAYAPLTLADFVILPGAAEAVCQVREAGFLALVVTNQPEIASGELSWETLAAMHQVLLDDLSVDAIYVCPHRDSDGCVCRKPLPGMLREAASDWNVDLTASFLIGDRWRDIDAGRSAGCRTILIDRPYGGATEADYRTSDIRSAAQIVVTAGNST